MKTLDEAIRQAVTKFYGNERVSMGDAIAEIKAAILAELPESKETKDLETSQEYPSAIAYNKAITDIKNKLQ